MGSDDVEDVIGRLVAIHGEGGAAPTAADWRAIFAPGPAASGAGGGSGGVVLVNLLRFRSEVDSGGTGAEAYGRYTAGIAGAFGRAGGELVLSGRAAHAFGLGAIDGWDAVVVTRYPSAWALAGMWLDPEFVAGHHDRVDGLARSQVLLLRTGD